MSEQTNKKSSILPQQGQEVVYWQEMRSQVEVNQLAVLLLSVKKRGSAIRLTGNRKSAWWELRCCCSPLCLLFLVKTLPLILLWWLECWKCLTAVWENRFYRKDIWTADEMRERRQKTGNGICFTAFRCFNRFSWKQPNILISFMIAYVVWLRVNFEFNHQYRF